MTTPKPASKAEPKAKVAPDAPERSPMAEAVLAGQRMMVAGIDAQRRMIEGGFAAADALPDTIGVRSRAADLSVGMLDLLEQHVTASSAIAEEFATGLQALLTPASTAPTDPVAAARSGSAVARDVVDLQYDTGRRYLELAGRTAEGATGLVKDAVEVAA